jgi:hypothetical protein
MIVNAHISAAYIAVVAAVVVQKDQHINYFKQVLTYLRVVEGAEILQATTQVGSVKRRTDQLKSWRLVVGLYYGGCSY